MADTSPNLFVQNLVATLLPYFQAFTYPSEAALYAEVLATLESYGPRTRADYMHAALAVAFGFSALDTLAEVKHNPSLSPSLRLRMRACANGLQRSVRQNAEALGKRLACDAPRTAKPPKQSASTPPVTHRPTATSATVAPATATSVIEIPAIPATAASAIGTAAAADVPGRNPMTRPELKAARLNGAAGPAVGHNSPDQPATSRAQAFAQLFAAAAPVPPSIRPLARAVSA